MKKHILTRLGIVALLTVSCKVNSPSMPSSPESPSSATQTEGTPTSEPSTPSSLERLGTFVKGEKATEGTASIVTENGQNYLVLDDTFKTGEGPDVFVLLHKE